MAATLRLNKQAEHAKYSRLGDATHIRLVKHGRTFLTIHECLAKYSLLGLRVHLVNTWVQVAMLYTARPWAVPAATRFQSALRARAVTAAGGCNCRTDDG